MSDMTVIERAKRAIADTSRYEASTEGRDLDAAFGIAAMEAEGLMIVSAADYQGAVHERDTFARALRLAVASPELREAYVKQAKDSLAREREDLE